MENYAIIGSILSKDPLYYPGIFGGVSFFSRFSNAF